MAKSLNQVQLIGNLGKDPEVKFTPSGVQVSNFSVATSRSWKNQQSGEWEEETDWHNIVLWRNEKLTEYLHKGGKVYIQGRLQTRSWDDKEGKKHYMTEVIAEQVILLDGKPGNGGSKQAAPAKPAAGFGPTPAEDYDVPF